MKQVFYDPRQLRRKVVRRLTDVLVVGTTLVLAVFIFSVISRQNLPELLLPTQKPNYKALNARQETARKTPPPGHAAARRRRRRASEIVPNEDQPLRAAFYENDSEDFASFQAHIHQIDILFPDWLHVVSPDGNLVGATPMYPVQFYSVVDDHGVHGVDPQNQVKDAIAAAHEDTEIYPMLNDYDTLTQQWQGDVIGRMLHDPAARQRLHVQLDQFLYANPSYRGIALDFEQVPDEDQNLYAEWVGELHNDFQAKHLKVYVNVQSQASPQVLRSMSQNSDGVILMNYDEHEETSEPGPVASEPWFEANLTRALRYVPRSKLICGIGNYGFDWAMPEPVKGKKVSDQVVDVDDLTVQDAWQLADDAGADVHLAGDELNPSFAYVDEDTHLRHQVWFLDAVTALNEMRAGNQMGIRTFALWRLGEEDPSLWKVWNDPGARNAPDLLREVPPGQDVNTEGEGDILRIVSTPQTGEREIQMASDNYTLIDEDMTSLPRSYTIEQYGYNPHELALTFDDGPDPVWTPKILDVLQQYHAPGTFMIIGEEAMNNIGLVKREVEEGDEIANHTFTHPNIAEITPRQLTLELNGTERLSLASIPSSSARPTPSIRSRTPTAKPRPPTASSRWATPSSATRSTPTTGMSIRAKRRSKSPTACWSRFRR
jgi:spore germination protein YaaH